jgi:hypothetical protein
MCERNGRSNPFHRRLSAGVTSFAAIESAVLLASPSWGRAASSEKAGPGAGLLFLLPIVLLSFVALELVLWVLAPVPLHATCRKIERGRGLCLLTGVVATVVTLALSSISGKYKGTGELISALLVAMLLLGALIGTTAVTALLGRAVLEMAGRRGSRAGEVLVGSLLFEVALLFPVVGQVLGVYFVLVGLGGALLALMRPTGEEE